MSKYINADDLIASFQLDDDGTKWNVRDICYRIDQFPGAEPKTDNFGNKDDETVGNLDHRTTNESYIKRMDAINAIQEWGLIDGLAEGQAIEILSDNNMVPDADVVKVTRCRECVYYNEDDDCSRYADETYGISHSTMKEGFYWLAKEKK